MQKQKRRRITIEFLQEHFKEKECVLITQAYTNAHMELAYVCKNGHRTTTTWNNFSKGHGCLECSGRKKLNIEDVRACFEKEGYSLLSETYSNARTKLDYVCNKGHIGNIVWDKFQKGQRCYECFGNPKHSYEYVQKEFLDRGYTLLAKTYKNAHEKMEYVCENGHNSWMNFNKLQQDCGCRECFLLRNRGENHCNYNPNLSDEDRILNRDYLEYFEWRKSVYKKNNYKCVVCNSNKNINAHHLYNYADYPLLRTSIDNGETLCQECHIEFHIRYGKSYNTKEQFDEYCTTQKLF